MKHNLSNNLPVFATVLISIVYLSIAYAELPEGDVWTPPPKPVIKEPVKPKPVKPKPERVIKPIIKKYGLFVNTAPKGATIKITDIKPVYKRGIKLKPRSYRLKVSKSGYQTVTKTIRIRKQDLHLKIKLAKIKKPVKRESLPPVSGSNRGSRGKAKINIPQTVRIPAGSFTMGCVGNRDNVEGGCDNDEKPPHSVSIRAFRMTKYEITVGQYLQCVKAKDCRVPEWKQRGSQYNIVTGSDNHYKKMGVALTGGNYPIVGISWNDATAYARWLKRTTGKPWRLPSEAEWEVAARGGDNSKAYPWGNRASHNQANYGKYACCDGLKLGKDQWFYTAPVGRFPANGYGLHDMHGNVWEWVQDKWHDNY
ncbi:MAG: SUMF1/EgtB/PvdO family nonheme iron enzyme, partial [Cocleimonas sp.]|nr:SUMF1/EgtB/PvdO family nonheme iron enzyme [Cocleimonas sp.]